MALPNEWWKQADLTAGGTGLNDMRFDQSVFQMNPGYYAETGDSGQQVWNDPSVNWAQGDWAPSQGTTELGLNPDGTIHMQVKSADKAGSNYSLKLDPATGQYVPTYVNDTEMDTNSGDMNKQLLASLVALASAGMLAPSLMGAPAAAPAAAGSWLPSMPSLGQIYGGLKTGIGAVGLGNTVSNLTTGAPLIGNNGHLYNPNGSSGGSPVTQQPGQPGAPGGVGLNDLFGLLAGAGLQQWSNNKQDNFGQELKDMYTEQQGFARPYRERLERSYTPEGLQEILAGQEFSSGRDLYKNALDRKASQAGTLSNPIARQQLLDKYGATYMNDYRKGLQGPLDTFTKNAADYKLLSAMGMANQAQTPGNWSNWLSSQGLMKNGVPDVNKLLNLASTAVSGGQNLTDWWNSLGGPQGGNEDKGGDFFGGNNGGTGPDFLSGSDLDAFENNLQGITAPNYNPADFEQFINIEDFEG